MFVTNQNMENKELYEEIISDFAALLKKNNFAFSGRYNNKKHVWTANVGSPMKCKIIFYIDDMRYEIETKNSITVCDSSAEVLEAIRGRRPIDE